MVRGRAVASLELEEADELLERAVEDPLDREGRIPDEDGLGRTSELEGEEGAERGLDWAERI